MRHRYRRRRRMMNHRMRNRFYHMVHRRRRLRRHHNLALDRRRLRNDDRQRLGRRNHLRRRRRCRCRKLHQLRLSHLNRHRFCRRRQHHRSPVAKRHNRNDQGNGGSRRPRQPQFAGVPGLKRSARHRHRVQTASSFGSCSGAWPNGQRLSVRPAARKNAKAIRNFQQEPCRGLSNNITRTRHGLDSSVSAVPCANRPQDLTKTLTKQFAPPRTHGLMNHGHRNRTKSPRRHPG